MDHKSSREDYFKRCESCDQMYKNENGHFERVQSKYSI